MYTVNFTEESSQFTTINKLPNGRLFCFPNGSQKHIKLFEDTEGRTVCQSVKHKTHFVENRVNCQVIDLYQNHTVTLTVLPINN